MNFRSAKEFAILALLALVVALPSASAQGALSANEQRLVMDSSNLAQQLLSTDPADRAARALILLALTLDPKYVPAQDLMSMVESEDAIPPPRSAPKAADLENLLVNMANTERDEDMQLMYFLVVLVLNRDNVDARIYVAEAKTKERDLSLLNLFEKNKRLTLSVNLDYRGLLTPVYEQITSENLENRSETLMPKLQELADVFKERVRADEADRGLARSSLTLLGQLADLIAKRNDALERLERAKSYKPPLQSNSPLYQQELRDGRERGRKNALVDWKRNLDADYRMVSSTYRSIVSGEQSLDRKFAAARETVAVSDYPPQEPPVAVEPPVATRPPVDDQPPVAVNTTPTMPPPTVDKGAFGGTDEDVDQQWDTQARKEGGPVVDTSGMTTPDYLTNQVGSVAMWLRSRTHTTGQLVDKIVADDPRDGRVILYLHASKLFMAQNKDTRYSLTKSLQAMWGQRVVTDKKVASANLAYIYVLDDKGQVIGGSTTGRASSVWVKESL